MQSGIPRAARTRRTADHRRPLRPDGPHTLGAGGALECYRNPPHDLYVAGDQATRECATGNWPEPGPPDVYPSKITWAIPISAVCVMEREIDLTPIFSASCAATPCSRRVGLPEGRLDTSKSRQRTPRFQPVPIAFIPASLAANRPA